MPQRTIDLVAVLRRELPWFSMLVGALVASFAFAHWIVERGVILPSLAGTGTAPPWAWGALYLPELVACFMIGWRLRSWAMVGLYAGAAAALREGLHLLLRLAGEPKFDASLATPGTELGIALPLAFLAYAVVFAVAAASGREDAALDAE